MRDRLEPQIPPDFLVNAWLDAHFIHPIDINPLTRGFIPESIPPHWPPSGSDTKSDVLSEHQSSDCCQRPPKRPRLLLNSTEPMQDSGQDPAKMAGDRGRQCGGDIITGLNPFAQNSGAGRGASNRPSFPTAGDSEGAGGGGESSNNLRPLVVLRNQSGHEGESGAVDVTTHDSFIASLNTSEFSIPATRKRESGSRSKSSSPSKAPTSFSDIRRKRLALQHNDPAGTFGIPDLADYDVEDDIQMSIPSHVVAILQRFSPGSFELACVPQTAEIDVLLTKYFLHERIPAHARLEVADEDDERLRALNLVKFAIETHRACLRNSHWAEDEAAWYPPVRTLLSIDPPSLPSSNTAVPPNSHFLYRRTVNNLFLNIDATTKTTASNIPPTTANVKLDALIAFNPKYRMCSAITNIARKQSIKLNPFIDSSLEATIIVLGVEVKPTGGAGGEMEAEYQLGAWGMKTLNVMRALSQGSEENTSYCHTALSVSVCGHLWSLHVSYWRAGEIVTHGPVAIGTTDSLYGTLKIVAFVRALKEWARDELWGHWERLLGGIVDA